MALFTHDALILPDGRIELRVVDPANLRIIADVLKGEYQLAIGMLKGKGTPPCYPLVTQSTIIDFNQLEDDSLSIIIEGKQRVRVLSAAQTNDCRWIVRTLRCTNWCEQPIEGEFEILSLALEQFYDVNPELMELYSSLHLDDASWVSQRWLEVLPMYNQDKLKLLNQPTCHQTMEFVLQLIKSHSE